MFRKRIVIPIFLGLLIYGLAGTLTAQLRRTGDGLTGHIEMLGGAVLPIGTYASTSPGSGAQLGFIIGPQVNFKLKRVRNLLITAHATYQQNASKYKNDIFFSDPWKIFWLLAGVTWQYPINDEETTTFEIGALIGPAFISAPTVSSNTESIPGQNVTGIGSNLNLAIRFSISDRFTIKIGTSYQSTRAQYSTVSSLGLPVSADKSITAFNFFTGIGYRLQSK